MRNSIFPQKTDEIQNFQQKNQNHFFKKEYNSTFSQKSRSITTFSQKNRSNSILPQKHINK